MDNPYWAWRRNGGLRPDEVRISVPPKFTMLPHTVEVEATQLPQTARLMHAQLSAAGFEASGRLAIAQFPSKVVEVFAVQGVKRASDQFIAVQAHWLDGTFIGAYVHVPGIYHRELLTEWTAEMKPLLNMLALKKGKR